jgi:hypothetical protein
MDALAQLALMTKAKLLFEKPGSFLSFPVLSPISYKASDLNFDQNKLTPAQLMVLSDFSRAVNSRVTGPLYQMETDSYLWDTYQYVLTNATLARETVSSEDPSLVEAMQLLTAKASDGTVIDSPQMTAYKQYRDAWITATQAYRNQQLTAELSTDPAVKKQWERVDELKLRAIQQQSEEEWVQKGFKNEIDRALQIQQAHAAQSPQSSWTQWDAAFDPAIDVQTDTNNRSFALTSYSPQGIVDQTDWLTFHLTRNEINQLASQAPPELRDILAVGGSTSPVESLSFEYRSVALTRSWFRPPVFDARFWKLPEGAPEISDGGNPAKGAWPGYAAAVVFVRNITLMMRGPAPATPGPVLGKIFMVDRAMLRPQVMMAPPPRVAMLKMKVDPTAIGATALEARTVAKIRDHRRPPSKPAVVSPQRVITARLGNNTFRPIKVKLPPPPPPPPPPPTPNITTQQGTRGEISILAFICKWLPKSPNPDPGLKW